MDSSHSASASASASTSASGPRKILPWILIRESLSTYLFLTIIWLTPLLIVWMNLGHTFGIPLLFLEPEFLGKPSFLSYFLLGASLMWLSFVWAFVLFLLMGKDLNFLVRSRFPLLVFLFNILPAVVVYMLAWSGTLLFSASERPLSWQEILGGFGSGAGAVAGFIWLYLIQRSPEAWKEYATRILHRSPPRGPEDPSSSRETFPSFPRGHQYLYLTLRGKWRVAVEMPPEYLGLWKHVLRRHHLTILVLFFLSLGGLILLGWMTPIPLFRIPAAPAVILLLSVILFAAGALRFWLGRWMWFLLVPAGGVLWMVRHEFRISLYGGSPYQGLDYSHRVPLLERLQEFSSDTGQQRIEASQNHMQKILYRWYAKQRARYPAIRKPFLVVVCVSGGGLRAALWAFVILQRIDSALNGEFLHRVFLITGASGGLLGVTLFRELWYRASRGIPIMPHDPRYQEWISADLLNALVSAWVLHDILFPFPIPRLSGYPMDRGLVFEKALLENTRNLLRFRLGDIARQEEQVEMPLLILTPVISGTGQFLFISTQPMAYVQAMPIPAMIQNLTPALDLMSLLGKEQVWNLTMSTVLRASASFPVVMPAMVLPTEPPLWTTDAGIRDNFGVEQAYIALYPFFSWIRRKTSGIFVVMIRDLIPPFLQQTSSPNASPGSADSLRILQETILREWTRTPLMNFIAIQDHRVKMILADMARHVRRLVVIPFIYREFFQKRASLSWHLTDSEKRDILHEAYSERITQRIHLLKEILEKPDHQTPFP